MPPARYGQQSLNQPYTHYQPNPLQSHHNGQQNVLQPPPSLGTSAFNSGATPGSGGYPSSGLMNNGFERGLQDSVLPGQSGLPGYARAGPVQAHQGYDGMASMRNRDDERIRNVWAANLFKEMQTLRDTIEEYPYVAMDTEFPGIVARPIGQFTTKADYHYQTLRTNVDLLKMIQLGISLFKPDGSLPSPDVSSLSRQNMIPAPQAWQFNFKFSLETDMYSQESTKMLGQAGIDFDRHSKMGIEPEKFASLLISSGMVCDADVKWISFHSGYDFGYLTKLMHNQPMPNNEAEFQNLLSIYFPSLFDIKYMLKIAGAKNSINADQPLTSDAQTIIHKVMAKAGLQDIADELGVIRIGQAHQAGSDSLCTGQVYFEMQKKVFAGKIDESRYKGQIWGLNAQVPTGGGINMNGATFYNQSGTPSTPQTGNANLAGGAGSAHTPVPPQSSHGGMMMPGGYGNFSYHQGRG